MKNLKDAVVFAANVCSVEALVKALDAAAIAGGLTQNEEIIAAALLRGPYQDKLISAEGAGDLILSCSSLHNAATPEEWRLEKQAELDILASASYEQKIVMLSCCLADLRKIYREHLIEGDAAWAKHVQNDKFVQAWYYKEASELLSALRASAAYRELLLLIDEVFESQFDL